MIHPPTKFHTNPLSHFFNLHTSASGNNNNSPPVNNDSKDTTIEPEIDLENSTNSNFAPELTSVAAKSSFTIAAILGLKKNGINQHHKFHENENHPFVNGRGFNNVMNLSMSNQRPPPNQAIIENPAHQNQQFRALSLPLHHHHYHHQQQHLHHSASAGNSALQSLQQLQQQHTNNQIVRELQNRDKMRQHDQNQNKKVSLKNKRVRTIFTPEQLERLEAEFERQQYMVGPERLYLAHTLQLTEAQVKVWFQNRRIKWRKHHLEITQQRLALIRQRQVSNGAANPLSGGQVMLSPGANLSNSTDSTAEQSGSDDAED